LLLLLLPPAISASLLALNVPAWWSSRQVYAGAVCGACADQLPRCVLLRAGVLAVSHTDMLAALLDLAAHDWGLNAVLMG
jgi:hypothetical protein